MKLLTPRWRRDDGRSPVEDALGDGCAGTVAGATPVALPEIIAEGLEQAWPYAVLERRDGVDLGDAIGGFSGAILDAIAARAAAAQAIAALVPSVGRYGYAARPEDAPHRAWSPVMDANLARSRARIAKAGLFDQTAIDTVAALLVAARPALDAMPSVAFRHDVAAKSVIVTATIASSDSMSRSSWSVSCPSTGSASPATRARRPSRSGQIYAAYSTRRSAKGW